MPELWETVLNAFNYIGDHSGCHQLEERCFTVKGYTFPICARCTGVFFGQLAYLILFLFKVRAGLLPCVFLLGLMGLDWLIQYLNILPSTNFRRFVTGICGGFGVFGIYFNAGAYILTLFKQL